MSFFSSSASFWVSLRPLKKAVRKGERPPAWRESSSPWAFSTSSRVTRGVTVASSLAAAPLWHRRRSYFADWSNT